MSFINIATAIGNVVTACRATGHDEPYFEYGPAMEIVNTLMKKDATDTWKLKKYPAVFLFTPVTEKRNDFYSEVELTLVFVTETRPDWTAKQRDANVFDPVLIPLYDLFIQKLHDSPDLLLDREQQFDFTKHYYWGSSQTGANVANDYADAIEVKNLKVKLFPTCTGIPDIEPET